MVWLDVKIHPRRSKTGSISTYAQESGVDTLLSVPSLFREFHLLMLTPW